MAKAHAWLVVLLAVVPGCGAPKPPPEAIPPATVKWAPPERAALEEWTELIGTTLPSPDKVARVTAPLEGRVLSVFGEPGGAIREGQRVEAGAVLLQLDPSLVRAALAKGSAALEVLREEEKQAVYAVELARAEIERLKTLKAGEQPGRPSLISPVDQLKADYALKDAESKLKAAAGRVLTATKEQDGLSVQEKLHALSAPIAGRVGRSLVVRGQTLAAGTLVAEIIDIDQTIDVLGFVPPSQIGKFQLGQVAVSGGFDRDLNSGPDAEGEIVYIANAAEPETGNFAVKVRFDNKQAHLTANRVQRLRVRTRPGRECLSVRESAIQADEEIPTLVIVTDIKTATKAEGKEEKTGVAKRLQVVLGVRDRTNRQVEIISLTDPEKDPAKKWNGQMKGIQIIVEGGAGLQSGDAVRIEAGED